MYPVVATFQTMKRIVTCLTMLVATTSVYAQTCAELREYVESKGYGVSYYSYGSDAISEVTFYDISDEDQRYYFAIVQLTSSYKKYIYQVASNTKYLYSTYYITSAGKAFRNYIHPYNDVLGCAPDFE